MPGQERVQALSRRVLRNEAVRLTALAAILAAVAVVGANLLAPRPPAAPQRTAPETAAAEALPAAPEKRAERLSGPAAPGPAAPFRLEPPYDVLGGAVLRAGLREVALAGIEGPERDAVCVGGDGLFWACGLRARAALANRIRDQALVCLPLGPQEGARVLARCGLDAGEDLASMMVAEGWARPLPGWEPILAASVEEARSAGRGLWNGGWRLREP